MTEEQSYILYRNRQTNSCDCAGQDTSFDLEEYDPYIDKIRAFFALSLEHRIRSFLEELFVYSTDLRSARWFSCFKKFIDTVAAWKDPLLEIAEYDIDTMEEAIRSTVIRAVRDDLVTCFLDSIVLHRRLNKICRELDALGIEDNVLRSLNAWHFVNERACRTESDCYANSNSAAERNARTSATKACDAKEPARRGKVIEPLLTSNVCCDGNIDERPMTSDHEEAREWTLDANRHFLRRGERNPNPFAPNAIRNPRNGATTDKARESFDAKSRSTEKINPRLRMIIRKMYLENCGCSTLSRCIIARLPLPCESSDLIARICEADPSLTESCLIVMKRKFEASMRNVCSCLNDILGKLDAEILRVVIKALRLSCEIRPGYISFKLKANGTSGINKCLFVARVPICQNVRKRVDQRDYAGSSYESGPSAKIEEPSCSERREDDYHLFHSTLARIDEESEYVDNACCSQLQPCSRSLAENTAIEVSRDKTEDSDEEKATLSRPIGDDVSTNDRDLAIFSSCDRPLERNIETVSNTGVLCSDNSEERSTEYCESLDSLEIVCSNDVEREKEEMVDLDDSIMKNDELTRLAHDCTCSSYENFAEMNNEIRNILSDKDLGCFSRTADVDERDRTYLPKNEESNLVYANRHATCSITSFMQNSERDKQLVDLNCDHFSDNNIVAIDEQSDVIDDDSLNSAKSEIVRDSSCSYYRDDFTDEIDTSERNIFRAFATSQYLYDLNSAKISDAVHSEAVTTSSEDNDSIAISVRTPRLRVLSKGINRRVGISYPRVVVWVASGDDESISTVAKRHGRCDEADVSVRALIIPKRDVRISRNDKGVGKEVFDAEDKTRNLIEAAKRRSVSKERLRSRVDSSSSGISTKRYPRARNPSACITSNVSRSCCSFAMGKFTTSGRRDEFQRACKSRKLRGRIYSSSNAVRSVRSVTRIECRTMPRGHREDRYADVPRSQATFATAKFRDSIGRSVDKIMRLIPGRLARVLFNNRVKASRTFRENEESSGNATTRGRTSGSYVRRGYSITSCSTSDCCRRGCTRSRESSDVILSIRRNQRPKEGRMKFRDRRSPNGKRTLSSFRSIETSLCSYNLLTSPFEGLGRQMVNRNDRRRCSRREKIKKKQNVKNLDENLRCDFRDRGTNVTISSKSAEISFIGNDSQHVERYVCRRQKETRDNKHACKQAHNRSRRESEETRHERERCGDERKKYRAPIKHTSDASTEFSATSSSFTLMYEAKNIRTESRHGSRQENVKRFPPLGENRKISEEDTNISDFSNDRLYKRRAFAILTDICKDCADDLDLDFKSKLSRYVELCKNVKRSLMKTLDDIYEINDGIDTR